MRMPVSPGRMTYALLRGTTRCRHIIPTGGLAHPVDARGTGPGASGNPPGARRDAP